MMSACSHVCMGWRKPSREFEGAKGAKWGISDMCVYIFNKRKTSEKHMLNTTCEDAWKNPGTPSLSAPRAPQEH
ncbi:uncharacterized protein SETTUDRAFT_169103 [Exserohilum turcica Et28A]|uniref:Uncharacterized protein n=1 Tax=Exserohilum turcicum (strain 28A) TaxID=671987 RepID=R0INH6_EXST2|nr:uncharacterized protein SETTUDRAFT_169103 [Exserohilum turcica Et28A]EOA86326.1 hypothetical protein SETTUDRAFT_169103 [Exserohilum turcica Et28A]